MANCSATWLAVSGFMVMGFVLGLCLANHGLKVLPDGTGIAQPRWIQERILDGGSDIWIVYSSLLLTFHFHALEKEMETHSSVLAWRIPGMGEPGGLPSMGSHRVGHD